MDDRDFDPPESPESRAEYINRYLRHFHACILIIALGTLVGYLACSLELLEQHESELNRQLQQVRDVREQQSCALSAISSISRNLTGWAGIDTGLIATLGATDSTSNAWSGDGLILPVDGTMEEIPISVSRVHSWEEELSRSNDTTPDSPPHHGHGEVNTTMEASSVAEGSVTDRDHTAGVGSGDSWHSVGAKDESDDEGDVDDDEECEWAEGADDGDETDYYEGTELGRRTSDAEAPPWARSSQHLDQHQPHSEDATLEEHGSASSSSRPHHGPRRSLPPTAKARPVRFVGQRRQPKPRGTAGTAATPRPEQPVEDSSLAPWKRARTV